MKLQRLCKWAAGTMAALLLAATVLPGAGVPSTWDHAQQEIIESLPQRKSGFVLPGASVVAFNTQPAKGPGERMLGGAKITLLANQTDSQMLSVVIETKKKSLIVIDGGTPGDAGHLLDTIRAKGGKVSAWLITHPHSDHIGALTEIINNPDSQITIDNIYYKFADLSWYKTNEEYRADTVEKLLKSFESVPRSALHGDIVRGQEFSVDDIKIKVMNEPYLFDKNAINNSSVAYRLEINGKRALFLGDMGPDAGAKLLGENSAEELKADILQMSHHGQYGVDEEVYKVIAPSICLWPTPGWLWDNNNGGGVGSGPWYTLDTRQWMANIGVTQHYCIKDGDQVIQ